MVLKLLKNIYIYMYGILVELDEFELNDFVFLVYVFVKFVEGILDF